TLGVDRLVEQLTGDHARAIDVVEHLRIHENLAGSELLRRRNVHSRPNDVPVVVDAKRPLLICRVVRHHAHAGLWSSSVFRIRSTSDTRGAAGAAESVVATGVACMRRRIVRGIAYTSSNVFGSIWKHGTPSCSAVSRTARWWGPPPTLSRPNAAGLTPRRW